MSFWVTPRRAVTSPGAQRFSPFSLAYLNSSLKNLLGCLVRAAQADQCEQDNHEIPWALGGVAQHSDRMGFEVI